MTKGFHEKKIIIVKVKINIKLFTIMIQYRYTIHSSLNNLLNINTSVVSCNQYNITKCKFTCKPK